MDSSALDVSTFYEAFLRMCAASPAAHILRKASAHPEEGLRMQRTF